jgi:hypothetical protein
LPFEKCRVQNEEESQKRHFHLKYCGYRCFYHDVQQKPIQLYNQEDGGPTAPSINAQTDD